MMNHVRRNAILFLLVGGVAVIVTAYVKLSRVSAEVHGAIIQSIAERSQMTLNLFTKPIIDNLLLVNEWSGENRLNLSKTSALNNLFIPILDQVPHISIVIVADSAGAEYRLYRESGSWVTRFGNPDAFGKKFYFQRWRSADQATAEWSEPLTYDPREDAWYQGAMSAPNANDVVWTPTQGESRSEGWTVAAAVRLKKKENAPSYVAAFQVRMSDVLILKERLKATPNTKVFFVDEDGDAAKISPGRWLGDDADVDGSVEETSRISIETVFSDAVKRWRDSGKTAEASFEFNSGGKIWWAGLSPLALDDQRVWVGVLVPQDELLPETRRSRHLIFAIIGAVLVIGVLSTLLFIRFYGRPAGGNPFSRRVLYDSEAAVRNLIGIGESNELEFKSTLRWNLKAGRPGKEIEIAWLKTVAAYMNSEGGILLIGVEDDGNVFGLDTDDFQNDDKCLLHVNNLIKQHIGLEFSPFIRYEILPLDGKQILAVECTRSGEPVFLKSNKGEEFYIRSGPSSIRLSMSETLKYIKERNADG